MLPTKQSGFSSETIGISYLPASYIARKPCQESLYMNRNNYYPFVNTPLPYLYNGLEPFIDEETMHLHHDRHLQTYIDNLNRFLEENPALQQFSLEELLSIWRRLPCHLQAPLRNNAGGVYNHRFYFNGMTPPGSPCSAVYYDENVPLFRRNGYRKSGTMILRVRSRDTALKHLIDCYLRVYSLNAGSNPYTSRMDL